MTIRLSILFALLLAVPAMAVTNTVPCDFPSISNALMTAAEGDVVQIQPGSCTMTNQIVINRNVSFTIRGSGSNSTTLISGAGLGSVVWIRSDSTNVFTVSDLNCIGDSANNNGFFITGGNPPCTPMRGLLHFYNIQMTNVMYKGISMGYGDSFGLIDHCFFDVGANAGNYNCVVFGGNEYKSWTNAVNPLGTINTCVVEDCYFRSKFGNIGNGFFDGYTGMQAVVRHCTFDGVSANGCHGYDTDATSMRTLEVYNNVFTNLNVPSYTICGSRGGVFMVFSNMIYITTNTVTAFSTSPVFQLYRGCWGMGLEFTEGYAGYLLTNGLRLAYTPLGSGPYPLTPHPQVDPTPRTTNWVEGEVVVIGFQPTYVFNATLPSTDHHVKLGSTLAESVSNLVAAVNLDPIGAGTQYGSLTTKNPDLMVVSNGGNYIICQNRMDGTNAYGWPAAMQPGVLTITKFTNNPVTLYPCYSYSNLVYNFNGTTTNVNFVPDYTGDYWGLPNFTTNLLIAGRDFYNDTRPSYTPLVYPHPLQALETTNQAPTGKTYAPVKK